ncbi:ADP-ribose pyrophosphatase YjhB (NUDIX family) [Sediminihabitans luteus]|uniref:ADP-ribose pyrophosphatase YjhB (NUDIX family) n=1 Tax=Sediminihabitans luteus TaxID=1138585 RepID=A0A2M9CEL8_9CELL|nr:NUDIX domain-containing protein [Sediminihabitans luteus]PJJ70328.1 ADP-ribose pyrophosphatase YjhB (NUDIX family) [Sediminihabitans luteus]GII97799.1 NUDIX hydrolase [Sediminihabitans luteus]
MPIPPYVVAMRQHVGTALLWLPGVTAVVLSDDGRVLLGRRVDTGEWALVAGHLDPGEEPAVGAAREVLEETGVEVSVDQLVAVLTTPPVTYPNGDVCQFVDLTFLCRPVSEASAAGAHVADESLDVAWFALDALPAGLSDGSRVRLRHAVEAVTEPERGPYFVR